MMTAVAIPFSTSTSTTTTEDYSSLSRSPVLSFSPSSGTQQRRFSESKKRYPPVNATANHQATKAVKQKKQPAVAIKQHLPPIYSGSFIENFKAVLDGIDLDECDAHGENAFFVCDLAEVYRQHLRWQKELGSRIQPFFGSFSPLLSRRGLS